MPAGEGQNQPDSSQGGSSKPSTTDRVNKSKFKNPNKLFLIY